ncbi:ArsR family transcriptional regulator [Cronobacter turicensis]
MKNPQRRLTAGQAELLAFIIYFIRTNGYPPSITEMAEATESDNAVVSRRIKALIRRNCIAKAPHSRREIILLPGNGADDLLDKIYLPPARLDIIKSIERLTSRYGFPPSVYAIAKDTGLNESRIRRHLEFMEEKGLAHYDRRNAAARLLVKLPLKRDSENGN